MIRIADADTNMHHEDMDYQRDGRALVHDPPDLPESSRAPKRARGSNGTASSSAQQIQPILYPASHSIPHPPPQAVHPNSHSATPSGQHSGGEGEGAHASGRGTPEEPHTAPSGRKSHSKKQPLSCAECRRLKLRCDRVFPCQSCTKRGCAEICPDGALTSGKGSRFILANTEQLHAKIINMAERIRVLEEALAVAHTNTTPPTDPHPLLAPDLLLVKNALELYSSAAPLPSRPPSGNGVQHPVGNGSAAQNGSPDPHSPVHSNSQHLPHDGPSSPPRSETIKASPSPSDYSIPPEVARLSASFPLPWATANPPRHQIYALLPLREEATRLCTIARANALWQYNLDPSETWIPNILHHVYTTPLHEVNFRRVGLLYMLAAMGLLVDLNGEKESPRAEVYHQLARASLCEINVLDEPSLDLLQTLFYMIWYLLIFSDKAQAVAYAWSLSGLAMKLAQSLGLHREGHKSKAIPEESQRRQMLLWELLSLDARLALSLGRPPSISIDHVDCRRPSYTTDDMMIAPGCPSYHEWKHSFYEHCLAPVLGTMMSAHEPQYSHVIEMDARVRGFSVPAALDIFASVGVESLDIQGLAWHGKSWGPREWGLEPGPVAKRQLTMQQVLVSTGREIVLLQLHRNFLTDALSDPSDFSYAHRYGPSVIATYGAAARLIATLDAMEKNEPALSKRFMCFWFNAFSGAVALSLIVSRAPSLSLAPYALRELDKVHRLFSKVAEECPRVYQALPLLTRIVDKAHRSYAQWQQTQVPPQRSVSGYAPVSSARTESRDSDGISADGVAPASFAHAHCDLRDLLCAVERDAAPPVRELSPVSWPAKAGWGAESAAGQASMMPSYNVDSDEMLASFRRSDNSLADVETYMGGGGQRVGNHTFNLDFGALGSNLENQSNTYMSWF